MNKISLFSIAFVLIFGKATLMAQDYEPPKDIVLKTADDYAKYESEVIKCIDYLEKSPLGEIQKRMPAARFFIMWLTGSPTVMVRILPYVMKLSNENKDLFTIFMCGWTKYAIETRDYNNNFKCHLAGLRAIIQVYKENKDIKTDSAVDDLIVVDKEGKLDEWLQKKLEEK